MDAQHVRKPCRSALGRWIDMLASRLLATPFRKSNVGVPAWKRCNRLLNNWQLLQLRASACGLTSSAALKGSPQQMNLDW